MLAARACAVPAQSRTAPAGRMMSAYFFDKNVEKNGKNTKRNFAGVHTVG
jgi:hypothetical protein